ncbi:MAG: hypothetical protein M1819_004896 [Sarea resinae]|nr:MAG: hypothetical protein M1819_004896 [Sarea resinae]
MLGLALTATPVQTATYLLGVCLFSISFLVFLNSSVSFVITDLIKSHEGVGNAVGTLGFADELVVLAACPFWGILSDRIGVRTVCVLGYGIVGISLFVFVQAKNVYPQLLLARLFFSLGAAATSTMVTAILPAMTFRSSDSNPTVRNRPGPHGSNHITTPSLSSEITITPARLRSRSPPSPPANGQGKRPSPLRLAGIVGMFTGCGALVALLLFLPLPARFQKNGVSAGQSVADSYYVVGSIALAVSIFCFVGLRRLKGEEEKGWRALIGRLKSEDVHDEEEKTLPYWRLLLEAVGLGFKDLDIGLGYLGGFVARASSVGISLFIPLFVNAYFISSGLCKADPNGGSEEMKRQCRRAYILASELTGVSQLFALVSAPIFGYLSDRYRRGNIPFLASSLLGIIGYITFARLRSPEPSGNNGTPAIFLIVALIGISQVGAIVCSLGLLGRGIQGKEEEEEEEQAKEDETLAEAGGDGQPPEPPESPPALRDPYQGPEESTTLLPKPRPSGSQSLSHLKGSIAGIYSLAGGAGILLLTKLGGFLFDRLTPGAPFYMMAIFNGVLLAVGIACEAGVEIRRRRLHR